MNCVVITVYLAAWRLADYPIQIGIHDGRSRREGNDMDILR
jgi:hypothetical protein